MLTSEYTISNNMIFGGELKPLSPPSYSTADEIIFKVFFVYSRVTSRILSVTKNSLSIFIPMLSLL